MKDKESGVETPAGWHYQRQLTLVTDPSKAPDGKRFITFRNEQPGRGCQALQGFGVDGRKVAKLRLSFSVRGHDIRPGPTPDQQPGPWLFFTTIGGRRSAWRTCFARERHGRLAAGGKDDRGAAEGARGDRADRAVGGDGRDVAG